MSALKPPIAKIKETSFTRHGVSVRDNYAWLRDENYPDVKRKDVLDYLKAENEYTDAILKPHQALTDKLFFELKGRIPEEDEGTPIKDGNYFYSWRFEKGTEYRIWSRKPVNGGAEKILLNENERAKGHEYYRLGGMDISPNDSLMAWSEDIDGSERYTIRIKNLETSEILGDEIPNTMNSPVWTEDAQTIFYLEVDENWRPFRVKSHVIGESPVKDRIVLEEKDTTFFLSLGKTQSRQFMVIRSADYTTSESYVIPSKTPDTEPVLIAPRKFRHLYNVEHANGKFFILTNDTHKNFRLVAAPEKTPGQEHWKEVIAPRDENYLRGNTCFKNFLVVQERKGGLDQIRVRTYDGQDTWIPFPDPVYAASLGATAEFETDHFRLHYESMITPVTTYDYDVPKARLNERKVQKIPSGYDKSKYETKRLMVPARDGEHVPVTLLYRKERKKPGPLHLFGYGAYGYGMEPGFMPSAFSLVDRGFVYAIAHIRGGDELGWQWYEDGKLNKRKNSFHDFIDVARFLIKEGFTEAGDISIEGGSAGGELMGYVVNDAPELWRAALLHVPFVDVLNTMLDDSLALTPVEWTEWGNPIEDKKAFEYILSYSPYDNIKRQDYPAMFVTGSLNDPRVTYWEPAKWTAKVREFKTDDNTVIFKTNMSAGHGGKSGRWQRLHERSEEYTFLFMAFGMAG